MRHALPHVGAVIALFAGPCGSGCESPANSASAPDATLEDASVVDGHVTGPEDASTRFDAATGSSADATLDTMPPDDARSVDGASRDAGIADARTDGNLQDAESLDEDAGADATAPDGGFECALPYRAGHGDMYAAHDSDAGLTLLLRSHLTYPSPGGTEPLHDPEGICIVVPASSYQRVVDQGGRPPAGSGFEPIGVEAGQAFWFLSNSNLGSEQPFWGVATEGVTPSEVASDIRFLFERIEAPAGGELAVYRIAGIEPVFRVSTADPSATQTGAQEIRMPAGAHDHYLWSFTEPGHYAIEVVAMAAAAQGGSLRSPARTYHFVVEE